MTTKPVCSMGGLLCVVVLSSTCAPDHDTASPPPEPTAAQARSGSVATAREDTLTIASNTQATLGDVRIGAGNFWQDEYEDAAGNKRTGQTAGLWIAVRAEPAAQKSLRVGPGAKFSAGRFDFEVLEVSRDSVRLRFSPHE